MATRPITLHLTEQQAEELYAALGYALDNDPQAGDGVRELADIVEDSLLLHNAVRGLTSP